MALIVKVYINETVIIDIDAVRIKGTPPGICTYELPGGKTLKHRYSDGAEALAIKLLERVQQNSRWYEREFPSRTS